MNKYLFPAFEGFLSAYALTVEFHTPLKASYFSEKTDFLTTSIYELLGKYSFSFLILWGLCTLLFYYLARKQYTFGKLLGTRDKRKEFLPYGILAMLFGFFFSLGKYFTSVGYHGFLTGSLVVSVQFILSVFGFAIGAFPVMAYLGSLYLQSSFSGPGGFWEKNAFFKAFLLLFLFYLPFLLVSYPGNLCYDVIGQIEQVLSGNYSTHHPLLHTLLVGGMVKFGEKLLGSREAGLFLYVLMQTVFLLAAFATTIACLARQKISSRILWGMVFLYAVTPIYTNLSTTALKDVPFTAFVLLYMVYDTTVLSNPDLLRKPAVHLSFVFVQVGVITMRNNGLPLILLSGIFGIIYLLKYKKQHFHFLSCLGGLLLESLIFSQLLLFIVGGAVHAARGSRGEILSLPFQQTAFYLKERRDQVSEEELSAIENILGDADIIAASYDPLIADPVKALYRQDSSLGDLASYMKAYLTGGIKHPLLYTKAFLIHTYGWYSPSVANEIRYETDYDAIQSSLLFKDSGKMMVFLYRFLNRISFFGLLENAGFAFWLLSFLSVVLTRRRNGAFIFTVPLWICFLVCLAAPCFMGHPRYALPVIASLSYLFVYANKFTKSSTAIQEKR